MIHERLAQISQSSCAPHNETMQLTLERTALWDTLCIYIMHILACHLMCTENLHAIHILHTSKIVCIKNSNKDKNLPYWYLIFFSCFKQKLTYFDNFFPEKKRLDILCQIIVCWFKTGKPNKNTECARCTHRNNTLHGLQLQRVFITVQHLLQVIVSEDVKQKRQNFLSTVLVLSPLKISQRCPLQEDSERLISAL